MTPNKYLEIFRRLNFADSYLLGFQCDPFKVRLWIQAGLCDVLTEIGLHPIFDLIEIDFWPPQHVSVKVDKLWFNELPYDPDFDAAPLGSFEFNIVDLEEIGFGADRAPRYRITLPFSGQRIQFEFSYVNMRGIDEKILSPEHQQHQADR